MKSLIVVFAAVVGILLSAPKASAQFATFDASNLAQAVLSFLQDGDNMVINTEQFLQEMDKRYKEVRGDLYKAQSVIRMAQNYEQMARMFTRYVDRIKAMNGNQITYYQGRSMVYEGFQYLLFASREVKRAREYLDAKSQVSEEERIAQLAECDRRLSRANAALYNHIRDTYEDIDRGQRLAEAYESLEESFKINW